MTEKPSNEQLKKRVKELEKEVAQRKRAEETLRQSEKRLSQILRETSIPTFVIDRNHITIHCNRAFEKLTGISAEEIIGTNRQWTAFYSIQRPVMADLIVDNVPEKEIKKYYRGKCWKSSVVQGGYEAENLFRDSGQGIRWFFFTSSPLRDEKGNITGAIETLQNITERKKAETTLRESQKRLAILLDFVPYPIVVFSLNGLVYYLNPAFTETFGWTLDELEGKTIPYTPPGLKEKTDELIKRLFEEKMIVRHETQRLTKDDRILDVVLRAGVFSENRDEPAGELVILRDITREKRIARNNEAILRITMALPKYPDLEELLAYISNEVKELLDCEGALVILMDEEREELFFTGVSYDDTATEERVKDIRFPMDQLVAGKVITTGEPVIVNDASEDSEFSTKRDERLGYHTKNLLLVPLKSSERIIGVLCAINKKEGNFDETHVQQLSMVAGSVALSVENARFSEELKRAYKEVSRLNRAKDKVINHLSHELKTPVSVLSGSLGILTTNLRTVPEQRWKPAMERCKRNLQRIIDIQYEVEDIMRDRTYRLHGLLSLLLEECADELETLIAEEIGEGPVISKVRNRINKMFGPKEVAPKRIALEKYVRERLDALQPLFSHRQVEVLSRLENVPVIFMAQDPLQKVVDGLIKNAIENTPDEGRVEIIVRKVEDGAEFIVHDYGVGIIEEDQRRIFEGFFATQDTMAYSSKMPFDFNAGGKGADLLRMKIFSERHHFKIDMSSTRCGFISKETVVCPGKISRCGHCTDRETCYKSGETVFSVLFDGHLFS